MGLARKPVVKKYVYKVSVFAPSARAADRLIKDRLGSRKVKAK